MTFISMHKGMGRKAFYFFLLKLNFSLCEYKKGVFYLEKMYSNSLLHDKSNKFITFDRVK